MLNTSFIPSILRALDKKEPTLLSQNNNMNVLFWLAGYRPFNRIST